MYIVNLPCPRCGVERTMRRADRHPLCLNCLLRRPRPGAGLFVVPGPVPPAKYAVSPAA
jgi:hypothetical protein